MREKTCCFTGHRELPTGWKRWALTIKLEKAIVDQIKKGVLYFGAGGALGFDTLAAQTILRMKKRYPDIKLILVLPCVTQTQGWPAKDVKEYERIKDKADKVVHTSQEYTKGCMLKRNRHLVDKSPVRLTFREIEGIIGDYLSEESRFYEAFWYDDQPGQTAPMWDTEKYPFDSCRLSDSDYAIAQSWVSQGYKIKHLHLDREYVVFQRTTKHQAGLYIPQHLLEQKLPESFVQEHNMLLKSLVQKYGV